MIINVYQNHYTDNVLKYIHKDKNKTHNYESYGILKKYHLHS